MIKRLALNLGILSFLFTFSAQISLGKDFFVYVSPDPIGVNAFLQMGKTGTEAAAKKFGADVQTYESSTAAARRENVEAKEGLAFHGSSKIKENGSKKITDHKVVDVVTFSFFWFFNFTIFSNINLESCFFPLKDALKNIKFSGKLLLLYSKSIF